MLLSRSGIDIRLVSEQQSLFLESDARIRELERRWKASNAKEDYDNWHKAMERAGRHEDLIQHHIAGHAKAKRAYDDARDKGEDHKPHVEPMVRHRSGATKIARERGIHAADHAPRLKDEAPHQYAERLGNLQHGHSWRPSRQGGTISYDTRMGGNDNHFDRRDSVARAWKKHVKNGIATVGERTRLDNETGKQRTVGSYVHLGVE